MMNLAKVVIAEKSGRITLGTKLIKRFGKKFKLVKDNGLIVLVPLSKKASRH